MLTGGVSGMSAWAGVGALDASAADVLRDALFAAACELHVDAAAVLADSPSTTNWLRASPGGDGGDLETHVAVALFWGMRALERTEKDPRLGSAGVGFASRENTETKTRAVTVRSRFGTEKTLTAVQLAGEIAEHVSTNARVLRARVLVDARVAPGDSGVIRMTSTAHHDSKRADGELRCKLCGRFVAGQRALWWHSKTKHGIHHEDAAKDAADESKALMQRTSSPAVLPIAAAAARGTAAAAAAGGVGDCSAASSLLDRTLLKKRAPSDLAAGLAAARRGDGDFLNALVASGKVEALPDPGLDAARSGDLETLRELVFEKRWDPLRTRDRHGANALLWCAGAGHLRCVRFLCEEAPVGCAPLDPDDPGTYQAGRRAYRGRTALHWAARNGHLDVVKYLVLEKKMDVDRRTGEGTTAFHWAVWRGRLEVARWLVEVGACHFAAVNTFGCNAAMWVAQGVEEDRDEREALEAFSGDSSGDSSGAPERRSGEDDSIPPTAAYVARLGVSFRLLNANGHGVVHKAAQRGRRDACAFVLGYRWPRGSEEAPNASRSFREPFDPRRARRALVDANHLRRDDEGFRPSDLARLAGDARLHAWLTDVERAYDEDESRTETRRMTGRMTDRSTYTLYPPSTFYGAASLGDFKLLSTLLRDDVYELNDDVGAGTVLHVAVARGHVDLVSRILTGRNGFARGADEADVNKKSTLFFGATPLHLAAILFSRRPRRERALEACAEAEAELSRVAPEGVSKPTRGPAEGGKRARKEAKTSLKSTRKALHKKLASLRKIVDVDCAGAENAAAMYRVLLQAGADVHATASVPRSFHVAFAASSPDDETQDASHAHLVSARPRDLAGAEAALEVAALEREVAEAPPATKRRVSFSSEEDEPETEGIHRETEIASEFDEGDASTRARSPFELFDAGIEEAESIGGVFRENVRNVPGAFVLENVFGPKACAALCAFLDRHVIPRTPEKRGVDPAPLPRRESAAARVERLAKTSLGSRGETLEALFLKLVSDPLALVAATTAPDGKTYAPVEPSRWEVPLERLRAFAARCRPFLPSRVTAGSPTCAAEASGGGGSAEPRRAAPRAGSIASPGFEFSSTLRCYRYDPRTASPPHFDKPGPGPRLDGRETASGYSVVVYLSGDGDDGPRWSPSARAPLNGGETTFFEPLNPRDPNATDSNVSSFATSRSGSTWAVGQGAAPLARVTARVRPKRGAVLFFPHGAGSGCSPSPLHEGSAILGESKKYVVRTDAFFFTGERAVAKHGRGSAPDTAASAEGL